jgi:hypothetical protein
MSITTTYPKGSCAPGVLFRWSEAAGARRRPHDRFMPKLGSVMDVREGGVGSSNESSVGLSLGLVYSK